MRFDGNIPLLVQSLCNGHRLIIATTEQTTPMHRDRHNTVNIIRPWRLCQLQLLNKKSCQVSIYPWPMLIFGLLNGTSHHTIVHIIAEGGSMFKRELAEHSLLHHIAWHFRMDTRQCSQTSQAERTLSRQQSMLATRTTARQDQRQHDKTFVMTDDS